MAKMFYTVDEAAEKLGKSVDEVHELAKSGQIQEFRDQDKLMFKVEQIDLLGHSDEDVHLDEADMSSMIPLADDEPGDSFGDLSMDSELDLDSPGSVASGEFSMSESAALAASGSASALDLEPLEPNTKERTGVSIFDADELDTADPAAVTQITDSGFDELQLDSIGSGSGLLDLTRESDDTSLGAEFLDELYPGSDEQTVDQDVPGGGLFETTGREESAGDAGGVAGGAMVMAEQLDGASSGLAAGLSIGAVIALSLGLVAVILGIMGAPADQLMTILADNYVIIVGSLVGAVVVFGLLGFVLGKRSA